MKHNPVTSKLIIDKLLVSDISCTDIQYNIFIKCIIMYRTEDPSHVSTSVSVGMSDEILKTPSG